MTGSSQRGLQNVKTRIALVLIAWVSAQWAAAQGFINLQFDAPRFDQLQPAPGKPGTFLGTVNDVFPGWTVTRDGVPQGQSYFNDGGSVSPYGASLFRSNPIFGNYVYIHGETQVIVFSQTGRVPVDAMELQFFPGVMGTHFRINGVETPYREFGPPLSHLVGAADVRQFAGQEVELEFAFLGYLTGGFDIFGFTTIPEPETWALLTLGLATVLWCCRRSR